MRIPMRLEPVGVGRGEIDIGLDTGTEDLADGDTQPHQGGHPPMELSEDDRRAPVEPTRDFERIDAAGLVGIRPWRDIRLARHELHLGMGDVVRTQDRVKVLSAEETGVAARVGPRDETRPLLIEVPLELLACHRGDEHPRESWSHSRVGEFALDIMRRVPR